MKNRQNKKRMKRKIPEGKMQETKYNFEEKDKENKNK